MATDEKSRDGRMWVAVVAAVAAVIAALGSAMNDAVVYVSSQNATQHQFRASEEATKRQFRASENATHCAAAASRATAADAAQRAHDSFLFVRKSEAYMHFLASVDLVYLAFIRIENLYTHRAESNAARTSAFQRIDALHTARASVAVVSIYPYDAKVRTYANRLNRAAAEVGNELQALPTNTPITRQIFSRSFPNSRKLQRGLRRQTEKYARLVRRDLRHQYRPSSPHTSC
jgi:hypothetical protein